MNLYNACSLRRSLYGEPSSYDILPWTITLYGAPWCSDCRHASRWFDARGIIYNYINIDHDPQAAAQVLRINGGLRSVPTIVFPDGTVLVEPSYQELAEHVPISPPAPIQSAIMEPVRSGETTAGHGTVTYRRMYDDNRRQLNTYPQFSTLYNRLMDQSFVRLMFDPLRYETAGQGYGVVLEVGAGGG